MKDDKYILKLIDMNKKMVNDLERAFLGLNSDCPRCNLRARHRIDGCECFECYHDACPKCGNAK